MFLIVEECKFRKSFLAVDYSSNAPLHEGKRFPYWSSLESSAKYFSTYNEAATFVKENSKLIESYMLGKNDKIKICEVELTTIANVKIEKGVAEIVKREGKHLEYYPD